MTVQPDIFVIASQDAREARWEAMRHFLLFVEGLRPSTERYDRFTKRHLYQDMDVPLYWVIDADRRRAEVWTPEITAPRYEERELTWYSEGTVEPFIVQLAELFAS